MYSVEGGLSTGKPGNCSVVVWIVGEAWKLQCCSVGGLLGKPGNCSVTVLGEAWELQCWGCCSAGGRPAWCLGRTAVLGEAWD